MKNHKTYYRRNLPHYQPPGYTFFVTFRLAGSLPKAVIVKLKTDYEENLKRIAPIKDLKEKRNEYSTYQSIYFKMFDNYLDKSSHGPKWLKDERIANLVKEAIHFRDKKEYELISYTIMPNHVHMVFTPIIEQNIVLQDVERIVDSLLPISSMQNTQNNKDNLGNHRRNSVSPYIVTQILQGLKKYSGVQCNSLLNRSGQFWQHESYDHVVRDTEELTRIIKYILYNPVKANLVENQEDWLWSMTNKL